MTDVKQTPQPQETSGLMLNWGWRYDLVVWLLDIVSRGGLRKSREKTLDLAHLQPGERVLDVGCGTGTLALEAHERVGQTGHVAAIDPAPQQLARARAKARRHGVAIDFRFGVIERLPFTAQSFDAVLSTWMMHHLPDGLKRQGLEQIARVLKPGGRLVIVDAMQHGHGHVNFGVGRLTLHDIAALMKDSGYSQVQTGQMSLPRTLFLPPTGYILAKNHYPPALALPFNSPV